MSQRFIARERFDFPNGAVGYRPGGSFDCLGPYAKVTNCPVKLRGSDTEMLSNCRFCGKLIHFEQLAWLDADGDNGEGVCSGTYETGVPANGHRPTPDQHEFVDTRVYAVRRYTCYASGYADTFFSVPATTKIRGKNVSGFFTTDGDNGVEFVAHDRHVKRILA